MNLQDALGDWPGGNQNPSGGGPQWPGQQSSGWPGQPSNPMWPSGPGQPSQPSAPSGFPGAPSNPSWNSGPSGFPGAPSPANPSFPGQQPSGPGFPSGPGLPSGPAGFPSGPGFPSGAQTNLMMPFEKVIHGGLQDKKLITIHGRIKPHPDSFKVDFCTLSDLAFHFNPRFKENRNEKVIVCNTKSNGKWGREERTTSFPFCPGQDFEIKIMTANGEFKVAVNNSHLLSYKNRLRDMRDICKISVSGDCMVTGYNLESMR